MLVILVNRVKGFDQRLVPIANGVTSYMEGTLL